VGRGDGEFRRAWWDYAILLCAVGVFVVLGLQARVPELAINRTWTAILSVVLIVTAVACAWRLWKATRFA
jgi:cytochrome bd-type quinol oxidase subunit 2